LGGSEVFAAYMANPDIVPHFVNLILVIDWVSTCVEKGVPEVDGSILTLAWIREVRHGYFIESMFFKIGFTFPSCKYSI
jgi:hypothetical protein